MAKSDRLKVCLVKQHTTYDLYTRHGGTLRELVESSNWRAGPLGLWEAFDVDFRIVWESGDEECGVGRSHWGPYVQGWQVWPESGEAERAEEVKWAEYDVVISVDIAVPTRIVSKYPGVMWCYYFIEGGPKGIKRHFRGSPYYGYNVFLTHRLAKARIEQGSAEWLLVQRTKRIALDVPYYCMSAGSVAALYPQESAAERSGTVISHHSIPFLSEEEAKRLSFAGPVRTSYRKLSDIHALEVRSKYFVVHPRSPARAGTAVIEAVSAGCLALSPAKLLWGFPELSRPELEYRTFDELVSVLERLEADAALYERAKEGQRKMVELWAYRNPTENLAVVYEAFKLSRCSAAHQRRAERRAVVTTAPLRAFWALRGKAGLLRRTLARRVLRVRVDEGIRTA